MEEKSVIESQDNRVEQLQSILDHVGACIYAKDFQEAYMFANRMVCDLFGEPLEKILGYTDEDFFDLSVSDQLRVNDRHVLDEGLSIEREESNVIAETGKTRTYWTVKIALRDAKGFILGMWGISTDITERRKLESKVSEQKLLLDSILNNIDSYIYMKDSERRYLDVHKTGHPVRPSGRAHHWKTG